MKHRNDHKLAIAAVAASCFSNIAVSAKAVHYSYAAQRDERKGFLYTAAMEWRNAAELFAPKTRAAEYFWRQWERIMHLPRRLAAPITDSPLVALPAVAPPAMQPAIADGFLSATAA